MTVAHGVSVFDGGCLALEDVEDAVDHHIACRGLPQSEGRSESDLDVFRGEGVFDIVVVDRDSAVLININDHEDQGVVDAQLGVSLCYNGGRGPDLVQLGVVLDCQGGSGLDGDRDTLVEEDVLVVDDDCGVSRDFERGGNLDGCRCSDGVHKSRVVCYLYPVGVIDQMEENAGLAPILIIFDEAAAERPGDGVVRSVDVGCSSIIGEGDAASGVHSAAGVHRIVEV